MWPPVFLYGGFLVLASTYRAPPHQERRGEKGATDLPYPVGCFFVPVEEGGAIVSAGGREGLRAGAWSVVAYVRSCIVCHW